MARQSRPIPLLLTRPDPQGARFAAALAQRFGDRLLVLPAPLLAPRFLQPALPTGMAGVIFTSETAVLATAQHPARPGLPRPAWCVGDRTASVARAAGFDATSASGDATALIAAILAAHTPGPLLHLRGEDTRGNLTGALNSAGIETHQAVIYAQDPHTLPPEALTLLQGETPVIIPLFSPRTASIFADQAKTATAPLWLVAMSGAVAQTAAPLHPDRLILAQTPDATAMLLAIESLLSQSADLNPTGASD